MLSFLQRLFSRTDPLTRLARGANRDEFVRRLLDSDIWVPLALNDEGLDPNTPDELIAHVRRNAEELSKEEAKHPLVYEVSGRSRLPFFSTQEHAQHFAYELTQQRNRLLVLQLVSISGRTLVNAIKACDEAVLNDWTPDEYILSDEDRKALETLLEA